MNKIGKHVKTTTRKIRKLYNFPINFPVMQLFVLVDLIETEQNMLKFVGVTSLYVKKPERFKYLCKALIHHARRHKFIN